MLEPAVEAGDAEHLDRHVEEPVALVFGAGALVDLRLQRGVDAGELGGALVGPPEQRVHAAEQPDQHADVAEVLRHVPRLGRRVERPGGEGHEGDLAHQAEQQGQHHPVLEPPFAPVPPPQMAPDGEQEEKRGNELGRPVEAEARQVGRGEGREGEEGEAGERDAPDQQVDRALVEPRPGGRPARRRDHPEEGPEEDPRGQPAPGARRRELRGLEALGEKRRRRQRVITVEEGDAREGRAEEQEGIALAAVETDQGDRRHPEGQQDRHRLVQRVDVDVAHPAGAGDPGRQEPGSRARPPRRRRSGGGRSRRRPGRWPSTRSAP